MAQPPVQQGFGVVKAVQSGDCIVVMGGPQGQATKTLVLSGITAPKPCRNVKNPVDEPYAYESREFLRKKVIGKQVAFTIVAPSAAGDREYATVFSAENENLAHLLLKAGLASVKPPQAGAKLGPEKQILADMEQQAKDNGLGKYSKSPSEDHIRKINWAPDAMDLYNKYKGQEVPAVVNQFRDGTNLRLEVMGTPTGVKAGKDMMMVTLSLAGAFSPRMPMSAEFRQSQIDKKVQENPEYEAEDEAPAPFAAEAKQFAEARLLNRDVLLVIQGIDASKNLFGTLKFPRGNITLKLLENGLAEYLPWSASLTGDQDAMQAASQLAQSKRLGVWSLEDKEPEEKRQHFHARVVQIVSGDVLVVEKEDEQKSELRVMLSSIRAPKLAPRAVEPGKEAKKAEPLAAEAKEFLRKRLIGKKVNVSVDYVRSSRGGLPGTYVTVMDKSENIALSLVAAGLAECVPHQRDEARSPFYGKLYEAELEAKKKRLGKFASTVPAPFQSVDLTEKKGSGESKSATRAKGFLSLLQHDRPETAGVVEFCFGPTKFKIYCPKENCLIAFALVGVKVVRDSPIETEAFEFVKSRIFQHNVRLDVETVDAGSNFIGSLYIGHVNIGVALLKEGYASLFPYSASRSPTCKDLEKAEEEAKTARRGIWKDFVENAEPATKTEEGEEGASSSSSVTLVKVTEVADAINFYYRAVSNPNGALVDGRMEEFGKDLPAPFTEPPANGTIVAALYSMDNAWYRAKVEGRSGSDLRLCFVDFGNHTVASVGDLRPLPEDLQNIPPRAKPATLAGLKSHAASSEHFDGAASWFSHCALDREMHAKVEFTSNSGKVHVTLTNPENPEMSVNRMMVRDGWCRVLDRPEHKRLLPYCQSLRADEKYAQDQKLNVWEYGNVSEDEDEEPTAARGKRGGPPAKGAPKNANLTKFDGRPPKRVV